MKTLWSSLALMLFGVVSFASVPAAHIVGHERSIPYAMKTSSVEAWLASLVTVAAQRASTPEAAEDVPQAAEARHRHYITLHQNRPIGD